LLFFIAFGSPVKAEEDIHLFPDRSSAVSGDTVWFSVVVFNGHPEETSNVVHVQLDNLKNEHIATVSVLCDGGTGTGYMAVPDTLSTGVYVLRPFSFAQKSNAGVSVNQRLLMVYNRFDDELYRVTYPVIRRVEMYNFSEDVNIETSKDRLERGENVEVKIDIAESILAETSQIIITAGLEDPLAADFARTWLPAPHESSVQLPVSVIEKNGVLISGRVHSAEDNHPVSNAVVILSIPDSIPFFDYCISDSTGIFYFYLRNATGTADLVLQALAKNSMPCTIELFENHIDTEEIAGTEKILQQPEITFAESVIKAAYFTRFFKGYKTAPRAQFTMQREFKYPFYSEPSRTFFPGQFIDLPDFKEISREILHGVQYRERKNGTTIRLLDNGAGEVFREEPLKLLDGIPVFDPAVFAPLGTNEIDRVDVVFYKRFYGDLSFNGVLSMYTKNRSLTWVDVNPSTGHFEYPCLQPVKTWNFSNKTVGNTHVPNFNKVLFRHVSDADNVSRTFAFSASDIKGEAVIRVILVQKNHQLISNEKKINVE
jgi:hypothetical protein